MRAANVLSLAAAVAAAALLAAHRVARAYDPFLVAPAADVVEASPAFRYANMTADQALAELGRRRILYQQVDPIDRVRTPIRLTGRLHGVYIHSALPEADRPTTNFELCDARLALALDDFAAILEKHGVDEFVHFTMYRPAGGSAAVSTPGALPRGRAQAAKRKGGRSRSTPAASHGAAARPRSGDEPARNALTASRHPDGLAIDVGALHKANGAWLQVQADFHGKVGVPSCGPRAKPPDDPQGSELWSILCDVDSAKVFTYVLSPNFVLRHHDHFHMEIKPEVRWFLIH